MCGTEMPFDAQGNQTGTNGAKPPMKKSTRNWLLIGGLGAAAVVVWYVMRARSSSSSATDQSQADAAAGIDPTTGIPYSEEYGGYGVSGTSPSMYGYVDPTTGAFISGAGATAPTSVLAPSTNASWAQQVEAYLANLGYDPTAVAAALGKYLTGQALTADQAAIVAAAQGFYGSPPQGAPPPVTGTPTGNGGGGVTNPPKFKTLTVPKAETFAQYAKAMHWTAATESLIEQINNLNPKSKLSKGERVIREVP